MKKTLLSLMAITTLANAEMIRVPDKEVVFDTETNLIWQDDIEARELEKNWNDAKGYCKNLNLNGIASWELPDNDILVGLYPKKVSFVNLASSIYWSSKEDVIDSNYAKNISFKDGYSYEYRKTNDYHIRCVRAGQYLDYADYLKQLKQHDSENFNKLSISKGKKRNTNKLFLVKTPNGYLFEGADQMYRKLQKVKYSNSPFQDIQQHTQSMLNEYLSIQTIPQPVLPAPLNLVKDEFESKVEFAERVKRETQNRETQIINLQGEYRKKVESRNEELKNRQASIEAKKKEFLFASFALVMGHPELSNPTFDAETNTMYLNVTMDNANWNKKIGVKIDDRNLARALKQNVDEAIATLEFDYVNDAFVLKTIDVDFQNQKLVATLNDKDFQPEKVAVTLEDKKIAFNEFQNPNLVDKYQVSALGYSESAGAKGLKYDDDLTPLVKKASAIKTDPKKWLFAIGIENYDEADAVSFAKNSAYDFVTAAQKRFGIDERHTYALIDEKATSGSIHDKLKLMLSNVVEGDTVYFYYSGHGIPSPSNGEAYILPKDKVVDFITREEGFMLRNLYKQLSDSKASKVIAFMDSCFSGNTDGISNIKGVAATLVKTKKVEFDKEKMVVISAGNANQFSNAYPERGHRLFSYYLTKAIIERPSLDIDSLYKEIAVKVKDESLKMGDLKRQEPQIEGNVKIEL